MAENDDGFGRSLNDVISGFQGMQQTLGSFAGGRMTPQGGTITTPAGSAAIPSPPPPIPVFTPPPPPPPPPFIPLISAAPLPAQQMASAPMGGNAGMAGMMQQGVQDMRMNNINPTYAAGMDPSMNMPSAGMMTNPAMGVFRSQPVVPPMTSAPYSVSGAAPPPPLFPIPGLLRTRPEVQFARPFEASIHQGSEYQRLMQQGMTGFAAGAGNVINTAFGSTAGTVVGAGIGGAFGGVGGAEFGATIGGVGGAFLSAIPGANEATGALFRPAIERRAEGIMTQAMSRNFVVGGDALDITGRGLSTQGSMQFAQSARDIAGSSGGRFTQQDVLQMTQVAGEQGLMDAAQNPEQMTSAIKSMMSLVGTLAEVTGDPDFRRNIKRLGQLKQMGFEVGQMEGAATNLAEYARMAGTTVDQAMRQQGAQGAAMFQGQGLHAGQGMVTGVMGAGQARGMEASGALSATQVSLAGGQSGMTQRITEMSGAFLSKMSPAMMGALVTQGEGGQLTLDADKIQAIRTGKLSFQDALRQGGNLDQDTLTKMITQMPELKAELGNQLGTQGTQMAMLQQVKTLADQAYKGDMRAAGMAMFGEEGGMVVQAMTDPRYLKQQMQQHRVGMNQEMFEGMQRLDAEAENRPGIGAQLYRGAARGLGISGGMLDKLLSPVDTVTGGVQSGMANWLARNEELERRRRVGMTTYERGEGIGMGLSAAELAEDIDTSLTEGGRAVRSKRNRGVSGYMDEYKQFYKESAMLGLSRESAGRGGMFRDIGEAADIATYGGMSGVKMLDEFLEENSPFATPGRERRPITQGMAGYAELQARDAKMQREEAANIFGQAAASRMSQGQMTEGRASLVDKIGGYSNLGSIQSKLADKIKSQVGFGVGQEELISREDIAAIVGPEAFSKMSEQEIGALVRGAAEEAGPKGKEWLRETQKKTGAMFRETAQDAYAELGDENLQSALEGAGFGSVFSSVMGVETGISAMDRLSDDEKEVLKLMNSPIAPEIVAAAIERKDPKQGKKIIKAMRDKARADGPEAEKAQFDRLETARKKVAAMEEGSPEQYDILLNKAKQLGGQKLQDALKKDDAEAAVSALGENVGNIGRQLKGSEIRRSTSDTVRALREKGLTSVSGKNYKEVLKSLQAEGADKLTDAFGEAAAGEIMGLDAGDAADRTKFVELMQGEGGGGTGSEAVSSKGVSEGVSGGASAKSLEMTREMMTMFGNTMMQSNRLAADSNKHLRRIADAVAGKEALDAMNGEKEQ